MTVELLPWIVTCGRASREWKIREMAGRACVPLLSVHRDTLLSYLDDINNFIDANRDGVDQNSLHGCLMQITALFRTHVGRLSLYRDTELEMGANPLYRNYSRQNGESSDEVERALMSWLERFVTANAWMGDDRLNPCPVTRACFLSLIQAYDLPYVLVALPRMEGHFMARKQQTLLALNKTAEMLEPLLDDTYEAQLVRLEYLTQHATALGAGELEAVTRLGLGCANPLVQSAALRLAQLHVGALSMAQLKTLWRPIMDLASQSKTRFSVQSQAITFCGHLWACINRMAMSESTNTLSELAQLLLQTSHEDQPSPLRMACLHVIETILPLMMQNTTQLPPQPLIDILVTVVAQRLLQDDEEDVRNGMASALSPHLVLAGDTACLLSAQKCHHLLAQWLRKRFGTNAYLIQLCERVLSQNRAVCDAEADVLFQREKANAYKDDAADLEFARAVIKSAHHK